LTPFPALAGIIVNSWVLCLRSAACLTVFAQGELLDNRIGQQFSGQFRHPGQRSLVSWAAQLYLESLALADAQHLGEAEPLACACYCLALRIVNLLAEHHINDDSGHLSLPFPGLPRGRVS
jgi:hypothetical protein